MKKLLLPFLFSATLYIRAQVMNPNNPAGYRHFKTDYAEMTDIASKKKLSHRIFYEAPSTGPHKEWFDAVKQGDIEKVKEMLRQGQDIEAKDSGSLGQTALGWATFIGDEELTDYLIAQKADLWATDKADVYNALKSAVLGKNVRVVKKIYQLLKDKIDLDNQTSDGDGETYVMIAASNNRIEIVKYFISLGVNLNLVTTTANTARGAYNQSALSYACLRGHKEMQQLLIKHGAINHRTGKASCE